MLLSLESLQIRRNHSQLRSLTPFSVRLSGLKVSVTLAVVGAVVGEFVGSNSGIGYVMQRSIGTFDLPTMFAALFILALLGVILFWIVDRIERLVIPWHVSQREVIFAS